MRKRDYKAEYQRRNQKAIQEGYKGYGQKRRVRRESRDWIKTTTERMQSTGLLDSKFWTESESIEDLFDTSEFWEMFRNYYGKAFG